MKLSEETFDHDEFFCRPICLPDGSSDYAGQAANVSGWGTTSLGGEVSNVLMETQVYVGRFCSDYILSHR